MKMGKIQHEKVKIGTGSKLITNSLRKTTFKGCFS